MATKNETKKGAVKSAPTARVEFTMSDEQHAQVARSQKAYAHEVARKLDAGEELDDMGRAWAAGCLRAWADSVSEKPSRAVGQRKQFDHGSEALVFVTLRMQGRTPDEAYGEIADRVGVSEVAVQKAMRKTAPNAAKLLEVLGLENIPENLFRK